MTGERRDWELRGPHHWWPGLVRPLGSLHTVVDCGNGSVRTYRVTEDGMEEIIETTGHVIERRALPAGDLDKPSDEPA